MELGKINDRWELCLPADRIRFHAERPDWEATRLASCFELLEPGMTVYDIGAESGDFTALYAMWVCTLPDGHDETFGTVVPVDPQPRYWPSIRETWEANGLGLAPPLFVGFASDVTELHPPLLDEVDGELLNLRPEAGWPNCAYEAIAPDFGFRHLSEMTDSTRQLRIDDMPRYLGCRQPDAIIMDIEGAELRALRGALDTLVMHRPLVWVSVHEPTMLAWYNHTLDDLLGFMDNEVNYSWERLGSHGGEDFYLFLPREGL